MMKIKTLEKEIQVYTSTVPSNKVDPETRMPLYKWEVGLLALDDDGNSLVDMPFVSYVEFLLHETFDNPRRFIQKAPFKISEMGWGGFDLKITLHFVDSSQKPKSLTHDLNFNSFEYQLVHTLTFTNVNGSFLALLKPPGLHEESKSSSKRPRETKKRKPVAASKTSKLDIESDWEHESPSKRKISKINSRESPLIKRVIKPQPQVQPKPHAYLSDDFPSSPSTVFSQNSPLSSPKYSRQLEDTSLYPRAKPRRTLKWISHWALGEKLKRLEGDDIWEVVDMIQTRKTSGSHIDDKVKGKFTFDLYTLSDDLLQELWAFVNDRSVSDHSSVTSSSSH